MKEIRFPKLLVITINAWSNQNSTGNTISNHFGGWDKSKVSNLFLRNEAIENDICSKYYRICEKDLMNSFFSKKKLGENSSNEYSTSIKNDSLNQPKSKLIAFLVRIRPAIILFFREFFWILGFRKTSKLDDFLVQNDPEVIHMHCPTLVYPHRILHYCYRKTNAKVVLFFGDELYSHKEYWPLAYLYQSWLRFWVRKSLKISSLNYAATQELCDFYSKLFKTEFKLLYKGAEIDFPVEKKISAPIKIVYAGNLLYGRWEVLANLVKAINTVSINKKEFQLEIYSGTPLSNKMETLLNTKFSKVCGPKPFSEIKKIIKQADLVLHVESFKKTHTKLTAFSFSTKIIDCIESGSCIFAIGPSDLASINFLKQSQAAIVCDSYEDLVFKLNLLLVNPKIMSDNASKMYHYSKDVFNLNTIRENLKHDILVYLNH